MLLLVIFLEYWLRVARVVQCIEIVSANGFGGGAGAYAGHKSDLTEQVARDLCQMRGTAFATASETLKVQSLVTVARDQSDRNYLCGTFSLVLNRQSSCLRTLHLHHFGQQEQQQQSTACAASELFLRTLL